jgi:hypothetical protein
VQPFTGLRTDRLLADFSLEVFELDNTPVKKLSAHTGAYARPQDRVLCKSQEDA